MSEGHQEDVGAALLNPMENVIIIHVLECGPGRFVDPSNDKTRAAGGEALGGYGRVAAFAAQEEDAGAYGGRRRR
jgi:hypothetical protein